LNTKNVTFVIQLTRGWGKFNQVVGKVEPKWKCTTKTNRCRTKLRKTYFWV